jgi:hypothetical protein
MKAYLKIEITDVNDNYPRFEYFNKQISGPNAPPVYELLISLRENLELNTKILNLHAVDFDKEKNVTYSIEDSNGYLRIDRSTGSLYVNKLINYETVKWINASIYACDNDKSEPKSSELRVYCEVEDLNDNHPLFTQISSNNVHLNHHNGSHHNVTIRIKRVRILFLQPDLELGGLFVKDESSWRRAFPSPHD